MPKWSDGKKGKLKKGGKRGTVPNSSALYTRMADVPADFKSVAPVIGGAAVKLSLTQMNTLAVSYNVAVGNPKVKNPLGAAKAKFRKTFMVKGGKWMPKPETQENPSPALNELWAEITGSYEDDQRVIRDAVRDSNDFGVTKEDWDVGLEATFADKIIVANRAGRKPVYYQAGWKKDAKGNVTFDDIKQIKAQVAIKIVSEEKELVDTVRKKTGTVELNEDILTPIMLSEKTDDGGKKVIVGSVAVAQRAEILNANNRRYTEKALKEAVADVQMRMQKQGPLLMDSIHRVKVDAQGKEKNYRDLRETVALIHQVNWDQKTKSVSLSDIRFTSNEAGKDLRGLIEDGARLQVSQRAMGASQFVKDEGKVVEEVTTLHIQGWDFTAPGEASVGDADFDFEVITEAKDMSDKLIDEDKVKELIAAGITESEARVIAAFKETLQESGLMKNEDEGEESPDDEGEETPAVKADGEEEEVEDEDEEDPDDSSEKDKKTEQLEDQVKQLSKVVETSKETVAELTRKSDLEDLRTMAAELLKEQVAGEDYGRFDDKQKTVLLESIDPALVYGEIDVTDRAAVGTALKPMLEAEATRMDTFIAAAKVNLTGYPSRGEGGAGVSHVEVLNEDFPNREYITRLEADVEHRLAMRGSEPVISKDHPAMTTLNEIMAEFDKGHWKRLMNEANEEVTQDDVGVRVASISRVVIPAAFRRLTALQVCDIGTMTSRIEDVPIQQWLPAEGSSIDDDMASIEIAEGGTIPTAGVRYVSIPLIATQKAIRTFITSMARATAKGTAMNPEADAVAGLALDVQRRIDRLLWQMHITGAQMQSTTAVTSFELLTKVGETAEYESLNQGWVKFEFCKTYDGNNNPTGAKLEKLYSATPGSDITLQAVIVTEDDGTTPMVYTTDYSINWPDGTVTLTAAGLAKCTAAAPSAKYTYTSNAEFWSVIPPTGLDLYNHLINLKQSVGKTKVAIGNRNYEPNFIAMCLEIEDLVTSGPQFTASGARASDMLDRLNNVVAYSGLSPIKTSALSQEWVIIAERSSVVYRIHTPWSLRGPITDKDTGDDYYLAEEYSGYDSPVKAKLGLVGVTDLNTAQ